MRISHKYKFIFISIPKTGSTSVRSILDPYSDIISVNDKNSPYKHHTTSKNLYEHFESQKWDWNNYFKFTIVRNPWAKRVSSWGYRLRNGQHNYKEFKDFVKNYPASSMYSYISDSNGDLLINDFFKVEEPNNIITILKNIGIPEMRLPHKNQTKHQHYTEYYDSETRDIVAQQYSKDIEYFGYKFGD